MTMPFTDLNYKDGLEEHSSNTRKIGKSIAPVFGGSLDYYITPFFNVGVEYNKATLKEGPDKHDRSYQSDFTSMEFRVGVSLGQFVDYQFNDVLYALRGLNLSLGYGMISGENNVGDFGRENEPGYSENYMYFRKHAKDLGKSEFKNVAAIPINIGYNFAINNQFDEQKALIGLNLKTVFTNSDDINGYNDNFPGNKTKDFYTSFGVSLKYFFGPRNIYY